MFGLTILGTLHTAISLIALLAGYYALALDGLLSVQNRLGKVYVLATALTCISGFGIFQHGGFGKPHALGIVTLLTLALSAWAGSESRQDYRWRYVATLGFSLTLFFHMVPALSETFTRIPSGSPFFAGPDDPRFEKTVACVFVFFLAVMALQVRHLLKEDRRSIFRVRRIA